MRNLSEEEKAQLRRKIQEQQQHQQSTRGMLGAKSRLTAGLLGIFFGGWGIHRFYLGYTGLGVIQIVVTLGTLGFASLWGFIEGILILTGTALQSDAEGRPLLS